MSRFSEWFPFGALLCLLGFGLMRVLMLRARGVSVLMGGRQRTGGQMLADTVMVACLLAFAYETIAYGWHLRFHNAKDADTWLRGYSMHWPPANRLRCPVPL